MVYAIALVAAMFVVYTCWVWMSPTTSSEESGVPGYTAPLARFESPRYDSSVPLKPEPQPETEGKEKQPARGIVIEK
jgi:hypothetical protein